MDFRYEIENEKLRNLIEKKADEMHMAVGQLIWGYINRGLMDDNLDEDIFNRVHSKEFLKEVNAALGID